MSAELVKYKESLIWKENRRYRRITSSAANRPRAKVALCHACGNQFTMHAVHGWKGTPVTIIEEENSEMRGDDAVMFFHPECCGERG